MDAQEFRKDFLENVKAEAAATGEGSCAAFVKFTFSCSFRLFLTSYAWLLVMFSFTDFLLNPCLSTVSFESA